MAYDNTNSGILAVNENKTSDNHPGYSGTINVDGVDYWLSAWVKEGKSGKLEGKKYFSLALKPKEQKQAKPAQQQEADPFDMDSVPF